MGSIDLKYFGMNRSSAKKSSCPADRLFFKTAFKTSFKIAYCLLFLAFTFQIIILGIDIYQNLKNPSLTSKQILNSAPQGICVHHPQGCPRNCLCPKIHPEAHADYEETIHQSILNEPTLVNCTELNAKSTSPTSTIFLPTPHISIFIFDSLHSFIKSHCDSIVSRTYDPPQKVPIS